MSYSLKTLDKLEFGNWFVGEEINGGARKLGIVAARERTKLRFSSDGACLVFQDAHFLVTDPIVVPSAKPDDFHVTGLSNRTGALVLFDNRLLLHVDYGDSAFVDTNTGELIYGHSIGTVSWFSHWKLFRTAPGISQPELVQEHDIQFGP